VINSGRVAESLRWVAQAMDAAEACRDLDLLIVGHYTAVSAYFWLGNLIKAREHADRVLSLYSEERQAHLAGILNHDPKTMTLIFSARSAWMLDLGWALTAGSLVFDFLR